MKLNHFSVLRGTCANPSPLNPRSRRGSGQAISKLESTLLLRNMRSDTASPNRFATADPMAVATNNGDTNGCA